MLHKLLAIHRASQSRLRYTHFLTILVIYVGLGFHVGVWAVLLADLTNALKLSPALLGIALASQSGSGILLLASGSFLADRFSRRLILLLGPGGLCLYFGALSLVSNYPLLCLVMLIGGLCTSCYDLAANTLGGDYERLYAHKTMTLFHAGFSAGAALGALASALALTLGMNFRSIYLATGIIFALLTVAACCFPLPTLSHKKPMAINQQHKPISSPSTIALLCTPLVALAISLVCLAFFTDGAIEGYSSLYLRNLLGSGALLGGIGIAIFHFTGLLGRLVSTALLRNYGERLVITVSGLCAGTGLLLALSTTNSLLAVSGLLLVGLGQSPVVPTAFSLAAQSGSQQGARAVALVTALGYSVFLISPLLIGTLATFFSLRLALVLTIVTSIGIVLVARKLPPSRRFQAQIIDNDGEDITC
ncbi:MFS transporter [Ktedonosporobacter rubrisoli]|uniref:MFS transporter n=1 Tax=Ktedonosporobacter rubrisoli TaxID=2509675 RepID=A0A4P6JIY2_KTERU|nr:MFS transporter [Ktedonosporobacter rubrisoli]QBD75038.1 MFS transporter [Ktedonosporobacter rubrisoli]